MLFARAVVDRAKEQGKDHVSLDDVEKIYNYFSEGNPAIDSYFEQLIETCREHHQSLFINRMRRDDLNRVVVALFEEVLTDRANMFDRSPDRIPRQTLPAFLTWLRDTLGAEYIALNQQKLQIARERVERAKGEAFDWRDYLQEPDVIAIQADAAVRILAPFQRRFEQSVSAFIKKMNYNLAAEALSEGLGSDYLFNRKRCKAMLLSIISKIDVDEVSKTRAGHLRELFDAARRERIALLKMEVKTMSESVVEQDDEPYRWRPRSKTPGAKPAGKTKARR